MKFYFYPNPCDPRQPQPNPYSINFVNALMSEGVATTNRSRVERDPLYDLLNNSGDADIFILNWIEEIGRKRSLVSVLKFLIFCVVKKIEKRRIIWVFHNLESHYKEAYKCKWIKRFLLKNSDIILTLSKVGYNVISKQSDAKVLFYHHPINSDLLSLSKDQVDKCYDILIWGSIVKYKGIVEFLEYLYQRHNESKYRILILGRCKDEEYKERLESLCSSNIEFYDRFVDFDEVSDGIAKSRYVLFPYLTDSVSSSGALIDSVTLNGCCIGPAHGAFKDLAEEGACLTYERYEDIIDIIHRGERVDQTKIKEFVERNTWESFAKDLKVRLLGL